MNSEITGHRISYFVFSIFVSCLIVFTIHKGFKRQDIITIPVFAILLFLIIDFSAKSKYESKMESFLNEGFNSELLEKFKDGNEKKNPSYKFRTSRPGLIAKGTLINSGLKKDASEKDEISKVQCPPKNGKKGFWVCNEMTNIKGQKRAGCGCMYEVENDDPTNLFSYDSKKSLQEESKKNPSYKFRTARPGLLSSGTLINSGLKKDASEKDEINKVECPPKDGKKGFWVCNEMTNIKGQKRSGCGCMYEKDYDDKQNLFYDYNKPDKKSSTDNVTEETYQKYASVEDKPIATKEPSSQDKLYDREQMDRQPMDRKPMDRQQADRQQADRQPADKSRYSKPSVTPSADKKAKEAINRQNERPDINKHLMDDGNNGLTNRNSETNNPININVSYNNNRPYTVNDFNNADIDKNLPNSLKKNDINTYRFDDGNMNRSVRSENNNMNPSNTPQNDNMNQKYYPSNIKNPLNKNQSNDPKVNENYELKTMRRILNEKNDPSPVILENSWSQWKSVGE